MNRVPQAAIVVLFLMSQYAGPVAAATDVAPTTPAGASVDSCPRPPSGAPVPEPKDLRSVNGVLQLNMTIRNVRTPEGFVHYCYVLNDGTQSPTLRVAPGDELILNLRNYLTDIQAADGPVPGHVHAASTHAGDPCASGVMTSTSTNLHFHGLTIPARCHQDEVLKTSIQPGDPPFEYRFKVPDNEPPGLYWYHPHIHGFSSKQVMGGASGALIVEGLERFVPEVAGLPERVFVIRDQELINPNSRPSSAEPVVPKPIVDTDGDITNNNTGFGTPARDLSINFVPVPYPDYPPAKITLKPGEHQLWRVLNASAITYLHLALLYDKVPQMFGIVAIDGVAINRGSASAASVKYVDHIAVPPGSRVEFIMQGPPEGAEGLFITRMVNTGQDGENDPNRALASVVAARDAPSPVSKLPATAKPSSPSAQAWVGSIAPVRVRHLYFSERRADEADPNSAILFFITVDGQTPIAFDPSSTAPNIVAKQGDVEDWIIENRSLELHAFHIHQLHFQLIEWYGIAVNETFLRDTVSVPFFDNHMTSYPSVRVRMDFRDPNTVGTFAYHCHLLEHEDGGMMGTIRVDPADPAVKMPDSSRIVGR